MFRISKIRLIITSFALNLACAQGMETSNIPIFNPDTQRLLNYPQSEALLMETQNEINQNLKSLENIMQKYVHSLPLDLQEALQWKEQFSTLKDRLIMALPLIRETLNNAFKNNSSLFSRLDILALLGLKPVSVSSNLIPEKIYSLITPFNSYKIGEEQIMYNTDPIFRFEFIKKCYDNKNLQLSDSFIQSINEDIFQFKSEIEEWIGKFPLPLIKATKDITEDEIALLLGYIPRAYETRLQRAKKDTKSCLLCDVRDIIENPANFRTLGIEGIALLNDYSPYVVLYGAVVEYILCSVNSGLYLSHLANKIIITCKSAINQKVTHHEEFVGFINDLFKNTGIDANNIGQAIKTITYEQKIIIMKNLLSKAIK